MLWHTLHVTQGTKKLSEQGASAELAQLIAECLSVRKDEIREQLVKESCNISQAYLSDFDWKLKVCNEWCQSFCISGGVRCRKRCLGN